MFRQKFNIAELTGAPAVFSRLLLVEPESYLRKLYHSHLSRHNFEVSAHPDLESGMIMLKFNKVNAAVIGLKKEEDWNVVFRILKSMRSIDPGLPFVTLGENLPLPVLPKIMALGAASHLERRLSRPDDIAEVVKAVLRFKDN